MIPDLFAQDNEIHKLQSPENYPYLLVFIETEKIKSMDTGLLRPFVYEIIIRL